MTPERREELLSDTSKYLSLEEIQEGWRFCCEWDGLLINLNTDKEGEFCTCIDI